MKRLVCLFFGVMLSCNEPETSGTNTNWLRACQNSAECGGLTCSCGYCTPNCDTDADCTAVGGICGLAEATAFECRGNTEGRLCLPRCSSSNECAAGQFCYRGACTHALSAMDCSTHPGALVCEDFEGTLDGYRAIVTSGNQAMAVALPTPSGERALEARVQVAPSTAYLRADFAPKTTGSIAVRSWIQVPAGQSSYDLAPIGFWSEQEPEWALRVVAKGGRLEAWSYTTPLDGSVALSVGEWHCLEASVEIAEAGHVRIALDGTPFVDMPSLDTLPTGGIGALAMGTEWAGATATMLVDRVLLGPTAGGCWE